MVNPEVFHFWSYESEMQQIQEALSSKCFVFLLDWLNFHVSELIRLGLHITVCPALIYGCVYVLLEGSEDLCQRSETGLPAVSLPPLLSPLITSQLNRQEERQDGDTSAVYQQRGKLAERQREKRVISYFSVFLCHDWWIFGGSSVVFVLSVHFKVWLPIKRNLLYD